MERASLREFLSNKKMTASERDVAEFFLRSDVNPRRLSTRKIAEQLGVSDMTVLRFVRKLGYSNFTRFCEDWFPEEKTKEIRAAEEIKCRMKGHFQSEWMYRVACSAVDNVYSGLTGISDETLAEIVDALIASENRYIAGFRMNAGSAAYLAQKLRRYLRHVTAFIVEDAGQIEKMLDMGEKDCLLLFAFAPYSRMNATLLEIARERGTKVIVVTDQTQLRDSEAVLEGQETCLFASVKADGELKPNAVPMGIIDAILMMVEAYLEERCSHEAETYREAYIQ